MELLLHVDKKKKKEIITTRASKFCLSQITLQKKNPAIWHIQFLKLSVGFENSGAARCQKNKMDIPFQELSATLEHMARSIWTLPIDLWTGGSVELWSCLIIQAGMSFFTVCAVSQEQIYTCHFCCPSVTWPSAGSLIRPGGERNGKTEQGTDS